jgi:phosphopantothenoylcysteine decarboxylase/phosphopantothenate--cysteine ligase
MTEKPLNDQRILLIIGGGIAAYKSLDLVRRLKERGAIVRAVLTEAGAQFVTPLAVGAITGERVFTSLFDLTDEQDVGHIRLARDTDLIIVAPATADLMAKMASGLANDLASTALLATDKPVLVAPAMNPRMWSNAATQRNVARLREDGFHFVGPNDGPMAERGESGVGRMAEPLEIAAAVEELLSTTQTLAGKRVLITSGPTHEPIDPVRVLANRSSGRQGHALAAAARRAGAEVVLVAGPVSLQDPPGVETVHVQTAREMLDAVKGALPADIAIFAAAVADWRVADESAAKMKKGAGGPPRLELVENPDILATVARLDKGRPMLVVGFAAETQDVVENAREKLARKGCDIVIANDVSPATGIMGGGCNSVHIVTKQGVDTWPSLPKDDVAARLISLFAGML